MFAMPFAAILFVAATVVLAAPEVTFVSPVPSPTNAVASTVPVTVTPVLVVSSLLPPDPPPGNTELVLPQYNSTLRAAPLVTPFSKTLKRLASSPPSPLQEAPFILFIPIASVS